MAPSMVAPPPIPYGDWHGEAAKLADVRDLLPDSFDLQ
eukprot:CAMPEP_0202038472 /NCGR_PEP_ID=MMETSP0962-20130828/10267_1 /ASSEMBLY_ACC=CAM_ASM_000488 /TAXON_ID=4773 /ORGANISM="Schizochytrium aggregatum, Strain ATCC28209" /LENGTH=37 /DNA_ID= /DNA_START= /DNA_END= /DNA_ORIENTATION=